MVRQFSLFVVAILCASIGATADQTVSAVKGGWKLVWSDEFSDHSLDRTKWRYEVNCAGGGNNELQCYTPREQNSFISAGVLHIVAHREDFRGPAFQDDEADYNVADTSALRHFTSARLRSRHHGDWQYGRIEVSARLPQGQGIWPAIWMLPTEWRYGGWPHSGEIDIMEAINSNAAGGNRIYGTLHYGEAWPNNKYTSAHYDPPGNVWEDFHQYAIEWERDEIRWYLDGIHYGTQRPATDDQPGWYTYRPQAEADDTRLAAAGAPFDQPFHLILNLAVGGNWPGEPDDNTVFPQTLAIDYVRVYRCTGGDAGGRGCASSIDPKVKPAGTPLPDLKASGKSRVAPPADQQDQSITVSRSRYREQLAGFWLGASIANWTGLITEMDRVEAPFYTDRDWGADDQRNIWGNYVPHAKKIDFYTVPADEPWGADDDTDIEYLYLHLLNRHDGEPLTPAQIRAGWLEHIYSNEDAPDGENFLWVSNERAYYLMRDGILPPQTSEPKHNPDSTMIDAQLTTELFGLLVPTRPDVALQFAELPIRTTASGVAAQIARFYVVMHALVPVIEPTLSPREKILWLAAQARSQLANDSYAGRMYDFIYQSYLRNPDKNDWELTRDAIYRRYQLGGDDGYQYQRPFDAGINFAASLVSLFYGGGDLKRTVQIGALAGWDSDNPTATWGGLLGFMLGRDGIAKAFPDRKLSDTYWIHRTRRNFPDYIPNLAGEDTFTRMAERGVQLVDQIVERQLGGHIDPSTDSWIIPRRTPGQPSTDRGDK
ncbi:ADP-ribosylglycohydrolase family protein [Microbulbifer sp. TYP-18]|uniref:ADP-ribosylglycohydrolase family protein n=1 Tax=Microbulbifer sp. TYP-18 TaxID=3230024 RepID=UPI0034C61383